MDGERGSFSPALWAGLFAIAAGVILLLDHLGIVQAGHFFRFWPVILVAIGLHVMLDRGTTGCRGSVLGGGLLATWGLLLILLNFGYLSWPQIWPIALIAFGVILLWQSLRPGRLKYPALTGKAGASTVFGSTQKMITDQDFQQLKLETVFGNIELDLLSAGIPGEEALVDVSVVFGSIEIRVPVNWKVDTLATAVFGSVENKTRPPLPTAPIKTLKVRGDIVFGSVVIKN
jgi:predicted membrane protein